MSETNGENPENPYGNPPPPSPYTPPSNPYGAPPPTNPYSGPQFNPSSFPTYGNGPQYGGAPGYPGAPGTPGKTDGMAIGALVASVLGFCTCIGFIVGIVLGFISLSRTKVSGAGGRGMAIAGIVIGFAGIVLGIIGVVVLAVVGINRVVTPGNAEVGQCVDVTHDGNSVSMVKKSCTDAHDGEIVATATVDAENREAASTTAYCATIIAADDEVALSSHPELKLHLVTENPDDMQIGDHIACYVEGSSKLTEDVLN